MFLEEESTLDEVYERPVSRFIGSRPSTAQNSNSLTLQDAELEDDDIGAYRSAGTLNSASSSRARMLAQQRELQLKKRQNQVQTGGMIRSSIDTSAGTPAKGSSNDGQFTPAIRQFSAPKAVRESMEGSEFIKPKDAVRAKATTPRRTKYSDEEDDDDDDDRSRRAKDKSRDRRYDDDVDSVRKGVRDLRTDDRDRERERERENAREREREKERRERDREREREREKERERERRRDRDRDDDRRDRRERDRDRDRDDRDDRDRRDDRSRREDRDRKPKRQEEDFEEMDDRGYSYAGASKSSKERDRQRDRERDRDRGDRTPSRKDDNSRDRDRDGWDGPRRNEKRGEEPTAVAMPVVAVPSPTIPPDLSDMRKFLLTPIPKECGVIQCQIRRNKSGTNKLFPIYSLYLKEGDTFLMASRKRPKNKTSNYLISMDQNDLNRSGHNYLGKLRSNFVGTEFQIFDDGINPKESEADEGPGSHNTQIRCDMGAVMYAANVLGSRGPRKMQVSIPALDEDGHIIKWRDGQGPPSGLNPGEDMLSRMRDRNFRDLSYLINKPPRWNEQVGAYVLNFNGRVTMASVKNFQLVDPEEQNAVVLQFGRVAKDEFTMDMQWPISPFQAFAVTLSSFDSKIACD